LKAPAKPKKSAEETTTSKTESGVKAKTPAAVTKTAAAETKPLATTVKASEVAEQIVPAASTGPQRVLSKAKTTQATAAAPPTHQQIAQLAHRFWKERGGHHGSHEQDWLQAERELRGKAS
jgi:hypothetical protein